LLPAINLGVSAALLSAFSWAVTTVLMRSQSTRIDAISLNATRSAISAMFFISAIVVTDRWEAFQQVTLVNFLALFGSLFFGFVLGDTLFFRSTNLIGVSIAFPISMTYPLYVLVIAWLFLGETITLWTVLGTVVVIAGTIVTALATRSSHATPVKDRRKGLLFAIATALCFALSTSVLKIGVQAADVLVVSFIRLSLATAVLFAARGLLRNPLPLRAYGRRAWAVIWLASLIGSGLGTVTYVVAVQQIGAAIAATLATTAPLFAAPISVIFLKERLTAQTIVGMVLCLVGVWLVTVR
jgi:DME family drug/metabolite transporter